MYPRNSSLPCPSIVSAFLRSNGQILYLYQNTAKTKFYHTGYLNKLLIEWCQILCFHYCWVLLDSWVHVAMENEKPYIPFRILKLFRFTTMKLLIVIFNAILSRIEMFEFTPYYTLLSCPPLSILPIHFSENVSKKTYSHIFSYCGT